MSNDLKFNVILDGAYPYVPHASERASNYIDLPNKHYDPVLGQHILEDQLETLAQLERFGFDGAVVSEQHNGPIGLHGNPMLAGAWLAARTTKINVVINGPIMNRYSSPVRLAEEIAVLDTMSRGRLVLGLPMGHGMQYHSMGDVSPATARARYREAHDLLVKALTEDGPFEWRGEFYNIPYVNLWPKPLHMPEIIIPGGGSVETLELVAKHRYGYQGILTPRASALKNLQKLRDLCEAEGYELERRQVSQYVSIHVAETDEQARREIETHELWSYQNFFRSPNYDNFPPGYVTVNSMRGMLSGGGYRSTPMEEMSLNQIEENHWAIFGSPATVADKLRASVDELGAGAITLVGNFGTKPRWLTEKSLSMFAEEVIPKFRSEEGKGSAPGYSTLAEYGARRPREFTRPTIVVNGERRAVQDGLPA